MTNDLQTYSLVLEVNRQHYSQFAEAAPRTLMRKAAKAIAFSYITEAWYHSNEKWDNNGDFHPHLHIFCQIPRFKECQWLLGLQHQLRKADRHGVFSFSNFAEWTKPEEFEDFEGGIYPHLLYLSGDDETPRPTPPVLIYKRGTPTGIGTHLVTAGHKNFNAPLIRAGALEKLIQRKELNLTTRRLAPQEKETVKSIFETTNLTKLNQQEQIAFTSIKSQFERSSQLSNKQLNYLESLHTRSKRGVYGTAESDVDRIAHKLSTVFNPIGRAR